MENWDLPSVSCTCSSRIQVGSGGLCVLQCSGWPSSSWQQRWLGGHFVMLCCHSYCEHSICYTWQAFYCSVQHTMLLLPLSLAQCDKERKACWMYTVYTSGKACFDMSRNINSLSTLLLLAFPWHTCSSCFSFLLSLSWAMRTTCTHTLYTVQCRAPETIACGNTVKALQRSMFQWGRRVRSKTKYLMHLCFVALFLFFCQHLVHFTSLQHLLVCLLGFWHYDVMRQFYSHS